MKPSFTENYDNRNLPDLSKVNKEDYTSWFEKHSITRAPDPKYSSP